MSQCTGPVEVPKLDDAAIQRVIAEQLMGHCPRLPHDKAMYSANLLMRDGYCTQTPIVVPAELVDMYVAPIYLGDGSGPWSYCK